MLYGLPYAAARKPSRLMRLHCTLHCRRQSVVCCIIIVAVTAAHSVRTHGQSRSYSSVSKMRKRRRACSGNQQINGEDGAIT